MINIINLDESNIQTLTNYLYTVFDNLNSLNIRIIFSDNLYDDAIRYCDNKSYKSQLLAMTVANQDYCRKLNGLYLYPETITSKQMILVSTHQLKDGYSFFSTAVHEIQHVLNHQFFIAKYCNNNVEDIYNHPYRFSFSVCDEFFARKKGHSSFLYVHSRLENLNKQEVTNILYLKELPLRLAKLRSLKESGKSFEKIADISAILGILSVWEEEYNIDLNGLDAWNQILYEAINKYKSIKDVNFEEIEATLQLQFKNKL